MFFFVISLISLLVFAVYRIEGSSFGTIKILCVWELFCSICPFGYLSAIMMTLCRGVSAASIVDMIRDQPEDPNRHVYVIIHNIDGPGMRIRVILSGM